MTLRFHSQNSKYFQLKHPKQKIMKSLCLMMTSLLFCCGMLALFLGNVLVLPSEEEASSEEDWIQWKLGRLTDLVTP